MRLIPIYSMPGYLKDPDGNIRRMHKGHLYRVPTHVVDGEECITLPNGKPVRVSTLLTLGVQR